MEFNRQKSMPQFIGQNVKTTKNRYHFFSFEEDAKHLFLRCYLVEKMNLLIKGVVKIEVKLLFSKN